MRRLFHNVMTILLSGAVLASSVLPPAVCHAHSGGDRGHTHGRDHAKLASDDHDHAHKYGHPHTTADSRHDEHGQTAGESTQSGVGIELAAAHLHFSIAGFDYSLPLPCEDGSNGPLTPAGDDAAYFGIVRLTDDTITVARVGLSVVVDLSTPAPLPFDSSVDATAQADRWLCARAADRTLLCDSARCKRSGVLLI